MKSLPIGKRTSVVEVSGITKHGVWLFVKGREYFLSFEDFPWFKEASVATILHVIFLHDRHLHWPDLDVDLELESILHPGKYPLTYKQQRATTKRLQSKSI